MNGVGRHLGCEMSARRVGGVRWRAEEGRCRGARAESGKQEAKMAMRAQDVRAEAEKLTRPSTRRSVLAVLALETGLVRLRLGRCEARVGSCSFLRSSPKSLVLDDFNT